MPDEFRRATPAEIATAHAWVAHHTADWADDSLGVKAARQREYQRALEIIIFANGGRYAPPEQRIAQAIAKHYEQCKLPHPTNRDWFACEARAIADTPAP